MPPLPLAPNRPLGAPDIGWVPTYDASSTYAGATTPYGRRSVVTPNGDGSGSYAGGGPPPGDPYNDPTVLAWEQKQQDIVNKLTGDATGLERDKLVEQYKDARKGRENALQIAQLQAGSSRYGVDKQYDYNLQKLQQDQAQFQQNHGLDLANAYGKFASDPDMMFARNDFMDALGRVGQGLTPTAATSQPTLPHANTWQDFAALSGYQGLPAVADGTSGSPATAAGAAPGPTGGSGSSTPTDPRLSAVSAITKALPPSGTPGADGQDWSALNAIYHLYNAAAPGSVERLGAARQKIAEAGLARAGFDPNVVSQDYTRAGVGQQSVGLA